MGSVTTELSVTSTSVCAQKGALVRQESVLWDSFPGPPEHTIISVCLYDVVCPQVCGVLYESLFDVVWTRCGSNMRSRLSMGAQVR